LHTPTEKSSTLVLDSLLFSFCSPPAKSHQASTRYLLRILKIILRITVVEGVAKNSVIFNKNNCLKHKSHYNRGCPDKKTPKTKIEASMHHRNSKLIVRKQLKNQTGLENIRVRSQHATMARWTLSSNAVLLIKMAGTRRKKKKNQAATIVRVGRKSCIIDFKYDYYRNISKVNILN